MTTKNHPLITALEKAPSQAAFARYLGVTPQTLSQWLKRSRTESFFNVPATQARKIAAAAGVKPASVRPDVFDPKWAIKRVKVLDDGSVK